jgi:hypothetical protein
MTSTSDAVREALRMGSATSVSVDLHETAAFAEVRRLADEEPLEVVRKLVMLSEMDGDDLVAAFGARSDSTLRELWVAVLMRRTTPCPHAVGELLLERWASVHHPAASVALERMLDAGTMRVAELDALRGDDRCSDELYDRLYRPPPHGEMVWATRIRRDLERMRNRDAKAWRAVFSELDDNPPEWKGMAREVLDASLHALAESDSRIVRRLTGLVRPEARDPSRAGRVIDAWVSNAPTVGWDGDVRTPSAGANARLLRGLLALRGRDLAKGAPVPTLTWFGRAGFAQLSDGSPFSKRLGYVAIATLSSVRSDEARNALSDFVESTDDERLRAWIHGGLERPLRIPRGETQTVVWSPPKTG